jgi:hypothetical protein
MVRHYIGFCSMDQGIDPMDETKALAMAALSVCESLLLSLEDRGVIDASEREGLLDDVRNAHLDAAAKKDADEALHRAVASCVRRMQAGHNALDVVDLRSATRGERWPRN